MNVFSAKQMQALDRRTIEEIGIPGVVLMENAGRGTFEQIIRRFPHKLSKQVCIVCGKGNNGGDGFVIARYLKNRGVQTTVLLLAAESDIRGDARINLLAFKKLSGTVIEISDETSWKKAFKHTVRPSSLVVDAVFGTGLSADVRGLHKTVIDSINTLSGTPVVSVDIPSGIDADSGRILGTAIRATQTCTFGFAKTGLAVEPGKSYAGILDIIDIGIPPDVVQPQDIDAVVPDESTFRGLMPPRTPDCHKGACGHVLIVSGSRGKTGAAALSGMAAMRSGAGMVTLAVPAGLNPVLESQTVEIMTEPLPDTPQGCFSADALPRLKEVLHGKSAVAVGPGLSVTADTKALLSELIRLCRVPMVIDADGLNILSEDLSVLDNRSAQTVLTPHPGEMSRLTGLSTAEIQQNRLETARKFSAQHQVCLVLKGAGTVICDPTGRTFINPTGNPGMATGGMGDALTGIIAALVAQGLDCLKASVLGVYAHAAAGDMAAAENAPIGILASDIIEKIPETLHRLLWK